MNQSGTMIHAAILLDRVFGADSGAAGSERASLTAIFSMIDGAMSRSKQVAD